MNYKQVIILRRDLNMRKGKMCAQSAHASMKVILDMMEVTTKDGGNIDRTLTLSRHNPVQQWLEGKFAKIVVGCQDEKELFELYRKAKDKKIPCAMITDAGKTEFNGVPTKTAVAIGPWIDTEIDEITGELKLL